MLEKEERKKEKTNKQTNEQTHKQTTHWKETNILLNNFWKKKGN